MNQGVTYSKAICIMLMVLGHSRCGIPHMTQTIYMFHMPLFFFMSGFCFDKKYFKTPKAFVIKRIKGLWLPYIKFGLIFLVLHNIFFYFNVYSDKCGYNDSVSYIYTFSDICRKAHDTVLMINIEQLLGGYWFLNALLWGALIAFPILGLSDYYKRKKRFKDVYIDSIVVMIILTTIIIVNHFGYNIYFMQIGARAFVATFFFYIGNIFSNYKVKAFSFYQICTTAIIVYVGSLYWNMQIGTLYYNLHKLLPYIAISILGIWMVYSFCTRYIGGG